MTGFSARVMPVHRPAPGGAGAGRRRRPSGSRPSTRSGSSCSAMPTSTAGSRSTSTGTSCAASPRMRNAAATIEPMFRRLDADRDGFLSLAEYRKSFPQRPGGAAARPDAPKEKPPGAAAPERRHHARAGAILRGEDPARPGDALRQVPREHRREAAGRAPARQPRGAPPRAATPARRSCPATPTRACSSARSATATKSSRCPPRRSSPTRSSPTSRPGSRWAPPTRGPGRRGAAARPSIDLAKGAGVLVVPAAEEVRPAGREADGLAARRHRPLPPRGARSPRARPGRRRRPAEAPPPGDVRPHRPAAHARGARRLPRRRLARRLRARSSIGCSPRPASASAGAGTGSTWRGSPSRAARRTSPIPRPGAIATGRSPRSTPTSLTTSSSASRSPATSSPPRTTASGPSRSSRPGSSPSAARPTTPRTAGSSSWMSSTSRSRRPRAAFLGLTVACARCHDHKMDPIPQRDYYALSGHLPQHADLLGHAGGRLPELQRVAPDRAAARRGRALGGPRAHARAAGHDGRAPRRPGPRARRDPPGRGEPRPAPAGQLDARDAPLSPAHRPARRLAPRVRDGSPRARRGRRQPALRPRGARPARRGRPSRARPRALRRDVRIDRVGQRPSRAGRLARLARESADRPRDREPGLAAPVRPRARAHARQLRRRRPAAEPSGAARHPGRRLHDRRLVDQEADPPDRAQPGLRARLGPRSAQLRGRPRQRPRLADEQAPAGGRGLARCPAVRRAAGSRPSRRSGRRWRARARGWRCSSASPAWTPRTRIGRSTCRWSATRCSSRSPCSTSPTRAS